MTTLSVTIDQLFQQAVVKLQYRAMNPKDTNAVGKLYEVQVLWQVLDWMANAGYRIRHMPPNSSQPWRMVLPEKPASANKAVFSYFSATKLGELLEVWTSLEFLTLSYSLLPTSPVPLQTYAAMHELDIAVFKGPIKCKYPTHDDLIFGASCKATPFKKDYLRELLGLRRETAMFKNGGASTAPWFVPPVTCPGVVNAVPRSVLALFCLDASVLNYGSVSTLGAFTYHFL